MACQSPTGPSEPVAKIAAAVAQTAAAVTGQPAPLSNEASGAKVLGFDTNVYPGDKVMAVWWKTPGAPYKWVGYYLPSPCHKDASWVGKRAYLDSLGWGFAVVYVGQQTWGKNPRTLSGAAANRLIASRDPCDPRLLTAERGNSDADDATARTAREGFAAGSVVFLDIEHMNVVTGAMREYYRAWVWRMLALGKYRPGVYVAKANAQTIHDDVAAIYRSAGAKDSARFWVAGGRYENGKAPQDVGFAFAGVWQGILNTARSVASKALPVDVNVSSWVSPSEIGVQ